MKQDAEIFIELARKELARVKEEGANDDADVISSVDKVGP
jgi:hypothetical protein